MKRFILLATLCFYAFLAMAQVKFTTPLVFMYGRSSAAIKGGETGKYYAAEFQTSLSKRECVKKVTDWLLKYGLVAKSNIHLDEISDKTSEMVIPVSITQTQDYLGMAVLPPVRLHFGMRFTFEHEKVKLAIEELKSETFAVALEEASQVGNGAIHDYKEEAHRIMMAKNVIVKALVFLQASSEERKQFYQVLDQYFDDFSSKVKVYDQLIKDGYAQWLDASQVKSYTEQNPHLGSKYILTWLENQAIPNGLLINVTDKRWQTKIRDGYFDKFFILMGRELGGSLVGIFEDDVQTWALEEGVLLPTEPKLKTQYKKKKKDFFVR